MPDHLYNQFQQELEQLSPERNERDTSNFEAKLEVNTLQDLLALPDDFEDYTKQQLEEDFIWKAIRI